MIDPRFRVRCRGPHCRAEIAMLPTLSGARLPVDLEPDPNGSVMIDYDLLGEPVAIVLGRRDDRRAGRPLWRPHFATCPDAELFR